MNTGATSTFLDHLPSLTTVLTCCVCEPLAVLVVLWGVLWWVRDAPGPDRCAHHWHPAAGRQGREWGCCWCVLQVSAVPPGRPVDDTGECYYWT